MAVDEIEGLATLEAIIASETRGVVVDFWGTWCQPCRALRPHIEQLADTYDERWRFVAVHVENNADIVERYGVMSTPTLLYLSQGDEVHRSAGAVTPSTIDEALQTHG